MLLVRGSKCLRFGLGLVLALTVARIGVCADAPSKMIHAIVQMISPDFPAESFATKPKKQSQAASIHDTFVRRLNELRLNKDF